MAVNQIGTHTFQNLRGLPGSIVTSTELIQRANVNGSAVRQLGEHGFPFTLVSARSVTDINAGIVNFEGYKNEITAAPLQLIWQDIDFDLLITPMKVAVLNVRKTLLEARVNIIPQHTAPPPTHTAWLEVAWTLVLVYA